MKAMRPLPTDYFTYYADEEIGVRDRSYATNWRDYGFSRFEDYLRVLDRAYTSKPNSVFECGSADGSVIRELKSRGIRARGCEFNKEILKNCDPDTRTMIARTNVFEVLNALPDTCYDCVYETAAQYIPEQYLESYFKKLYRIVKRDLVIVLHTIEENEQPHTGQLNHWPAKKWEELLGSAGFENAYIAKDVPPFYFRKI
jgi:cyclopropane fatty-acyl-phospholipid synthase-like methyltransferase